jgi:hypothetical protein
MVQKTTVHPVESGLKFAITVAAGVFLVIALITILIAAGAGWNTVVKLSAPFMTTVLVSVAVGIVLAGVLSGVYLGFWLVFRLRRNEALTAQEQAEAARRRAEANKLQAEADEISVGVKVLEATGIEQKLAEIQQSLAQAMAARIVSAPADHQVHRLSDPTQLKNETATPLHLASDRPTGGSAPPEPESRWAAWHNSHAKRPSAASPITVERATGPAALPDIFHLPPGGSASNVILGQHLNNGGGLVTLSAPIWELVHIASGGATDSGKSNLLRVIALQMILSPNVMTAFVDLKMSTFKVFRDAPSNMYPIISSEPEFQAITAEIYGEARRRVGLFEPYATVETVADYNRLADDPLPFVVMFIDEISNLLDGNQDSQRGFLDLVRYCRAAGIYLVAGGQTWDHRTMRTSIRQQFRTAFHFATNDKRSSQMLLNCPDAAGISEQGRAMALLPFGLTGGKVIEIQTPYLPLETARQYLAAPVRAAVPARPAMVVPVDAQRAIRLAEVMVQRNYSGASWRQVTEHVFGSGKFGTYYNDRVMSWMGEYRPDLSGKFEELLRKKK